MKCPHCDVLLQMADRQGIEIDYCPQCRGVWLDRGELDKIIDRVTADTANQPQAEQAPPARQSHQQHSNHQPHSNHQQHQQYQQHQQHQQPQGSQQGHHKQKYDHHQSYKQGYYKNKKRKSLIGEIFDIFD